jgi:hypothetical protein
VPKQYASEAVGAIQCLLKVLGLCQIVIGARGKIKHVRDNANRRKENSRDGQYKRHFSLNTRRYKRQTTGRNTVYRGVLKLTKAEDYDKARYK